MALATDRLHSATVVLRAGQPVSSLAARLAAAFGFGVYRRLNRSLVLRGPKALQPPPGDLHEVHGPTGGRGGDSGLVRDLPVAPDPRLVFGVERLWDVLPPPELFRGFDTELELLQSSTLPAGEQDAAALGLFDAICQSLRVPSLLVYSGAYVAAAWSPGLPLQRFERGTVVGESGRGQWAAYAQPPVAAGPPLWPTPEDPAGERVAVEWPADDDLPGQLYQRILADPDDDAPRLAYADAVAGEQPEYAGLIRTQVGYARDRRAGIDWGVDRVVAMHRVARSLQDQLRPRRWPGLLGERPQMRRGFLETMSGPAVTFSRYAAMIAGQVPLRMAYLTEVAGHLDELAGSAQMARLVGLSLWGNPIGDEGLARLLDSGHLHRLRYLSLEKTGVTPAGIELLAASNAVPALRYVNVDPMLRLNPLLGTDYDGTLVTVEPASLGLELGRRYDRAWLRWQSTPLAQAGWVPEWDEV